MEKRKQLEELCKEVATQLGVAFASVQRTVRDYRGRLDDTDVIRILEHFKGTDQAALAHALDRKPRFLAYSGKEVLVPLHPNSQICNLVYTGKTPDLDYQES